MSSTDSAPSRDEVEGFDQQEVEPLELFFDLVFVFSLIQVTNFLADHSTWLGMIQAVMLLAILWRAWVPYSWLPGTVYVEHRNRVQLLTVASMAAILVSALAIPDAFGGDKVLFAVAYLVLRVLFVVLALLVTDLQTQYSISMLALVFLAGPVLVVVASLLDVFAQGGLLVVALAVDYGATQLRNASAFDTTLDHFVERYRLIIIIALGELLISIGAGTTGTEINGGVILAAILGIGVVAVLWWVYFDYAALAGERHLAGESGDKRTVQARHSYSYLHLPILVGLVFTAFGLKEVLSHVWSPLGVISAVALYGGAGFFLLGHNVFRLRDIGSISIAQLAVTGIAYALIPVAIDVPALVALTGLFVLLVGLVAFQARYSQIRNDLSVG
ncbi:low temperature requirement protein A [Natrinema versiforme]|uniref:Low temperature requirement protein A n=1 Tax=Natrinema versiforme JCM 10478 TaxID=1227496 RepID=L9XWE5_9EURY|nr:low temperature requirement protein A [Natrinema versiforme]ELY65751.1 low temperature requirement protein A [Natrinema versiforme JCM 10478]